jgi:phage terminase small subunit
MPQPRKPTKLLKLQGTARRDRHGDPKSWLELPAGVPKPPAWLAGSALEQWLHLCNEPIYRTVLTTLDDSIMLAHCVAYSQVADAHAAGKPVSSRAIASLLSTIGRLGLSPSDRAKVKLPIDKPANKWNDFLNSDTAKPS